MAISLYDWTEAVFQAKLFAKDARIISFTSEGNKKAWANYAAVSAAKVALEAITRSMALEFAPYGIRANCIQAGVTVTRSFQMIPGNETLRVHALKHNPFKRLTVPKDIANVVYLLSKDEASWITGSIIPVNGGEHLKYIIFKTLFVNSKDLLEKLPYTSPFLFVNEISHIDENGVTGTYSFPEDSFFYEGHFKNNPVTPGVILTECMAQIGLVCLGIYLLNMEHEQQDDLDDNKISSCNDFN